MEVFETRRDDVESTSFEKRFTNMTDVQIAFEEDWNRAHGGPFPPGLHFTPAQTTALIAAIATLENSERQTRSACIQLVKLGELDGAEVMERHANGMLNNLTILKRMAGIESTQHPMPKFPADEILEAQDV